MKWLCIKDVVMNDGHRTFTEGKIYEAELPTTPLQWLFKHFKRICPECEQTNVQFNRDDYLCDNCVLNNLEMEL